MILSKIYFLLSTYLFTLLSISIYFISLLFKIQVQVHIKYYHITTSHTTHHIVETTVSAKTCTIRYVTGTTSSRLRMCEKKRLTWEHCYELGLERATSRPRHSWLCCPDRRQPKKNGFKQHHGHRRRDPNTSAGSIVVQVWELARAHPLFPQGQIWGKRLY